MLKPSIIHEQPQATVPALNVCLICPKAYLALAADSVHHHIGGAEMQVAILARELARRGHRVALISYDYGQQDGRPVDGVFIYNMCAQGAGIAVLRFLHPHWTSLAAAMARANADAYVQVSADSVTGQAALFCRRHHRPFVFVSASNADCAEPLINLHTRRERILYRYGIKHAHAVVAQTNDQREMFRRHFHIDPTIIRYCCPDPSPAQRTTPTSADGRTCRLLWIGRFSPEKRLELLLETAADLPELTFDVIGDANVQTEYCRRLKHHAARLPNVVLHGRLPHEKVLQFYPNAAAVLCTSLWEGFPNVFLEAFSYGVPIISTFDPDNIIEQYALGASADDAESFKNAVQALLNDDQTWSACSQNARRYYLTHHTPEVTAAAYENLLANLTGKTAPPPADLSH